jgi:pimeloyl-ACP methyl ester carboxylesterase
MHCLRIFLLFIVSHSAAAQAPSTNRVPPFGIPLSSEDRTALTQKLSDLEAELKQTTNSAFLPEVQIFHKAVDWALAYNEFYRTNEIAAAHKLIEQGIDRAKALREGKTPWTTATGLVVRAYKSRIDKSIQPYGLVVPSSFAAAETNRKFRLDVWLHGRDNLLTELKFLTERQRSYGEFTPPDTFVLHPYGRYCNAFKFAGETDVFEAIEHVRKHYPIDGFRIGIRGFSMGGAGVWHLAAHHPSFWVAAAPGAGFAETAEFQRIWSKEPKPTDHDQKLWHLYDATDYAANFFNCPVIAYSGELDRQKQAADIMEKAMAREGLKLKHLIGPKTEHKYEPATKAELDRQFTQLVTQPQRQPPSEVRFATYTLRYNSNYWITLDTLQRHWQRAYVNAALLTRQDRFSGEWTALHIATTNVAALTIAPLPDWKIDPDRPAISIDNTHLKARDLPGKRPGPIHLIKSGARWQAVREHSRDLRKRRGLQGPIDDAFMESFIMVRPTGPPLNTNAANWVEDEFTHATNEWRNQFRGDAIVKTDADITDEDIANNHLVLWGDPQSNKLLKRIAGKLPVTWNRDAVRIAGKSFATDKFAPVLIFPNPLNPAKYIVLNSGFTFCESGRSSNALQIPKLPDYAVLDMSVPRSARYPNAVVLAGFFDDRWR